MNEKVLEKTWNNTVLDIDGAKINISPLALEMAYSHGIKAASLIGKGKFHLLDLREFGSEIFRNRRK